VALGQLDLQAPARGCSPSRRSWWATPASTPPSRIPASATATAPTENQAQRAHRQRSKPLPASCRPAPIPTGPQPLGAFPGWPGRQRLVPESRSVAFVGQPETHPEEERLWHRAGALRWGLVGDGRGPEPACRCGAAVLLCRFPVFRGTSSGAL